MSDIIEALGNSLKSDLQSIDQIAQNLANINTPGYKSSTSIVKPFFNESINSIRDLAEHSNQNVSKINFSSGALKQSKRSMDVAISGNAFMRVKVGSNIYYSRNGSLHISASGLLVDAMGNSILSDSGEIQLDQHMTVRFSKNGKIYQDDHFVAQLAMVKFNQIDQVTSRGNGLFETPLHNISQAQNRLIHQGFIETSNVDTSYEMVRMMEFSKHFESVQKALSVYDQALGSGINKIGQ